MSENKDPAAAAGSWTGKPAGEVAVKSEVTPPAPVEAVAAQEVPVQAAAPVIAPNSGYAVFFFPAALDALGAVIKPYLVTGNGETHILCREVDTGGAFIELTFDSQDEAGKAQQVEMMVPANMVRLIMTVRSDGVFGFARPRSAMRY